MCNLQEYAQRAAARRTPLLCCCYNPMLFLKEKQATLRSVACFANIFQFN